MSELEKPQIKSNTGYRRFIAGQIVSILGSEVVGFVLGIYLARTYGNALYFAIVMILQFLPRVLISPIAGVWADKRNRKKIIITSDLLQAIVTTTLVVLFNLKDLYSWTFWGQAEIFVIFGFVLLRTVLQAIQGPSVSSTLPTIVPKEKLSRINALFQFATGIMGLVSLLVAGLLITLLPTTIYNLLWIDAGTFLIALVLIFTVKIPTRPKTTEQAPEQEKVSRLKKFSKDLSEGVKVSKEIKGLGGLMAVFVIANFLVSPMNTLSEILIIVTHGATNLEYVFASVTFSIGLVMGSLVASLVKSWKKMTNTMFICIIALYTGLFIYGATPTPDVLTGSILGIRTSFWIIAASGFITTFGIPIFSTIAVTMIQLTVPLDKMGRFMGFMSALISIITPFGYLLSGFLGEYLNIHFVVGGASIIAIIVMIFLWRFTDIRKLEPLIKEKLELAKQQALQQQQAQSEKIQEIKLEKSNTEEINEKSSV